MILKNKEKVYPRQNWYLEKILKRYLLNEKRTIMERGKEMEIENEARLLI